MLVSEKKQDDALEILLDYVYLMQEAANAYATELIWAFLLMIGAVSLWIWRLLGLQEAERHHLYMVNSRPVFPRSLSPISLQSSYFSAVYKSRLAAKDRFIPDSEGTFGPYEMVAGHDELFYKYRSVPRELWRFPDAKAENERSSLEERFLGQCDNKSGARNLGMFPVSSSVRPLAQSLNLLNRQRSNSPVRLPSIDKPKKNEYQRSQQHYQFKSSSLLHQPTNSLDDSRFGEVPAGSSSVVRKQDNLQDLSEQTARLTCDQDWTVSGDRDKGKEPSDDPIHGALHTGRKIMSRLDINSENHTKVRRFWNNVSRIPVKRCSDDKLSQVETDKAGREREGGEDEKKIIKSEAVPTPAPERGQCVMDKVLPHRQASRLSPDPTLLEPFAGTTASSSSPKINAKSAKDSITDRETHSSLRLGRLEASDSTERPKHRRYLMSDNADEELVQRLKRKIFASKIDRSSSRSNNRIKFPTSTVSPRRQSWLSEPKAETSHDPSLNAKIPPSAIGAVPEDEKRDAKATRPARLRTEHIERSEGKESRSSTLQSLQEKTTLVKRSSAVSTERHSAKEAVRDTGPLALTMESDIERSKKRSAEAGEGSLLKGSLDAGERLARLRRRLEHSLEYLKQQQVEDKKVVSDREEVMAKETKEELMPLPQREPSLLREDVLKLETPAVKMVDNNFVSLFPAKTVVAEEKVCELEGNTNAVLLPLSKPDNPTKLEGKLSRSAPQKRSSHRLGETFPSTDAKAVNASPETETMTVSSVSQRWEDPQHHSRGRQMEEKFLPSEPSDIDKKKPDDFPPVVNADDSKVRDQTFTSEIHTSKSVRNNLQTELGISPDISEPAKSQAGTNSFSQGEICGENVAENENLWRPPNREYRENVLPAKCASLGLSKTLVSNEKYEKRKKRREAMKLKNKENQDLSKSERNQSDVSNADSVFCQPTNDVDSNGETKSVQEEGKDAAKTWSNEQNPPAQENQVKNDSLEETNVLCSPQSEEQTPMKEITKTPSKDSSPSSKASHFQPDGTRAPSELSTNSLFTSKRILHHPSQQEQEGIKWVDSTFHHFTADHKHVLDEPNGSRDYVDWKRGGEITIRRRVRWRRLAEKQHMEGLSLKIPPPVPPKTCRPVASSLNDTASESLLPFSVERPPQLHEPAESMPEVLLVKPSVATETEGNLKEENEKPSPAEVEPPPLLGVATFKPPKPPKPQVSPKPAKGTYISTLNNTNAAGESGELKGGADRAEICEEKSLSPREAFSIFNANAKQRAAEVNKASVEINIAAKPIIQLSERDANGEGAAQKTSCHTFKETLQKFQKHICEGEKPPSPEHVGKAKSNLGTSTKFELEGKS